MAAPPLKEEISAPYPKPSNAEMRVGMGKLWDYMTGLLGLTGNAAEARSALGVPAETDGVLLGNPVASTQASGNRSTRLATTEFADRLSRGVSSVSVAGTGNVNLTASQYGTGILILTGALTGNRTVIVPTTDWRQVVENATTGGFTLTVKTAAGSGVRVAQGKQKELFTDGVSVLDVTTDIDGMPAGTIFDWPGSTPPPGALACPTAPTTLSRATYANLFAVCGTLWGVGDGATTFGMPWFPANYTGVQANGNVGTGTVGEVLAHSHETNLGGQVTWQAGSGLSGRPGSHFTASSGGSANLAAGQRVLKCVKF